MIQGIEILIFTKAWESCPVEEGTQVLSFILLFSGWDYFKSFLAISAHYVVTPIEYYILQSHFRLSFICSPKAQYYIIWYSKAVRSHILAEVIFFYEVFALKTGVFCCKNSVTRCASFIYGDQDYVTSYD